MIIEMNHTELNSLALGIFVDSCQSKFNSGLYFNMMETVYQQADTFAYALFTDAEVKPTLTLPRDYIMYDVLEWVQGERNVPSEWLLCWCNKWYHEYEAKPESIVSPDRLALQAIRSGAKKYLNELRRSERAVFSDAHFLRPVLPPELHKFLDDYVLMQSRRHHTLVESDIKQLLAYGYMMGIRAERQKRRAKV